MKFILLVEGKSERLVLPGFLQRWLNEKLGKNVGFKTVKADDVDDLISRAGMHLRDLDTGKTIAVIGILDLYGLKQISRDYRSRNEYHTFATDYINHRVNHSHFRMYFAVHELEAWLLSDLKIFPEGVRKLLPATKTPEEINFDNPPSKRLEEAYQRGISAKYQKILDGRSLFEKLDPVVAHERCPYLAQLMDEMLMLAKDAITN